MGSRGHLLHALSAAAAAAALCATLLLAGCVDFTEPRVPNAGGPALAQFSVSLLEGGAVFVNGTVQPGRDSLGVPRVPLDTSILVNGVRVRADTIAAKNIMTFSDAVPIDRAALALPVSVVAPQLGEVQASPPFILWFGMVRADSAAITLREGEDLVLRVRSRLGQSTPPVQSRQWFLDLSGGQETFRISGNGFPPDTMRIPPQWFPSRTAGSSFNVSLLFYQSAQVRPEPGDYLGVFSMDSRLQWTVQVR